MLQGYDGLCGIRCSSTVW